MKIILIRHGATAGNLEKKYIGRTDEPLCTKGQEQLKVFIKKGIYPAVQAVVVSPMRRCIQTARLIYPDKEAVIVEDLRECDFGTFEGKNYRQLSGNTEYQRWIDSNATIPFPGGEDIEDFKKRSVQAFLSTVGKYKDTTVYIVHGGTIMAVLSQLCGGSYYDYHCGNGEGYLCSLTDGKMRVEKKLSVQ